ncbi:hypothetical protein NYP20_16625 [Pseudomonas sp. N3-W]|uniref:hypothetical protein n=1 Tax=Pseudomonas sp. N3-W TaxID=2975049 RepID=UPI00217DEA0E|nr:hypothetical protein [Pseudomonas sp. N3-W]UWF46974.1 hypothetical protein NYP20_16625 [Pseudomonas sp. N3-W]
MALSVQVNVQAGQAQFECKSNGQVVPEPNWRCFPETGAGSIDSNGLYKADPNSHHQFVIITARFEMMGFFLGDAFFIQPLPVMAIPPKPAPEAPQTLADDDRGTRPIE